MTTHFPAAAAPGSLLLRFRLLSAIRFLARLLALCLLVPGPLWFGLAPGWAQFRNVHITSNNAPEETTVVINPANPFDMAAAANRSGLYYSTNGGADWIVQTLSSSFGEGGDPSLVVDTNNSYYLFHLSRSTNSTSIVCQTLDALGLTWSDGISFGTNGTKIQDKPYSAIDRPNNRIYAAWTQFDSLKDYSTNFSNIHFASSSDGGRTWTTPTQINSVSGDASGSSTSLQGAVPAVGPNGELYVTWTGPSGIVVNRSLDGGITWLPAEIPVAAEPGGWDLTISGVLRCNGFPVPACDLSPGPRRGTLYVNWSDQRNGTNDTDIWLVKSSDGGQTWTQPKRVNDDPPGKQQFFTWLSVDPADGTLYIVFYDRRNYPDDRTDVYLAVSRDGGDSFINSLVSATPFTPDATNFIGDYIGISAVNGVVRPVWTRADGGSLGLWTALINPPAGIQSLSLSNGLVALALTNLTSYLTNYLDRSLDLTSTTAWTNLAVLTGINGSTNWSETWQSGWTNAFYRLRSF